MRKIYTSLLTLFVPTVLTLCSYKAFAGTFVVINTNDAGVGSLRQAMSDANATPNINATTPDTIKFNISGSGVHIISPASVLPIISEPVFIDGWSQTGWSSTPLIELNGTAVLNAWGLAIVTSSCTIRGLAINNFPSNTSGQNGFGIAAGVNTITAIWIYGCHIGVDATGLVARPNGQIGILLDAGVANSIIGTNADGVNDVLERNVISANQVTGVFIDGNNNKVAGNYIGLGADGSTPLPNGTNGVRINNSSGNLVGGSTAASRNVISSNQVGVAISNGSTNVVQGNYIGTAADGLTGKGNTLVGIFLYSASANNTIGGTISASRNVISSSATGIHMRVSSSNTVSGNYIGIGADGLTPLGNTIGIYIDSAANSNTIGGTSANAGNIITNNSRGVIGIKSISNNIQWNSIYNNLSIGIDLDNDGTSANDMSDADGGANNLQNFPEFALAQREANGDLTVRYLVPSTVANSAYPLRVDFYKAEGTQGKTFLGSQAYSSANAGVQIMQTFTPATAVAIGDAIVATATDANNNTSEFSAVTGNSTLPIDFTEINAYRKNQNIQVEWRVCNEGNISSYQVEKSSNGIQFIQVGVVAAKANAGCSMLYDWLDTNASEGNNFYRITSVSRDGIKKISRLVRVNVGKGAPSISVYPNPVRDKTFMLQLFNQPAGTYSIQLFNNDGQKVFEGKIQHAGGSSSRSINVGSRVTKGNYLLQASNGDNKMTQQILCD